MSAPHADAQFVEPAIGVDANGEGEDEIRAREEWFLIQRTYPFDTLPSEGRRVAWASRPKLMKDGVHAENASGQIQSWHSIGPAPTTPQSLFNNWGVTSGRINAIAIAPNNPNLILIGASTGGIWRSLDGGVTFTPVSDSQVDMAVGSLAFSRNNPQIVYAGMGDIYNSYLGTGVLKSTDAGQTWMRVSNTTLPAPGFIIRLEVDPSNPDRLYVSQPAAQAGNSTSSSGLFVSSDGGVNWTKTFSGLTRDVLISPNDSQTLYLVARRVDAPSVGPPGVFKSTDGGNSWTNIYAAPSFATVTFPRDIRMAVSPADPQRLYVYVGDGASDLRVIVSTDGGASWIDRGAPGLDKGQFGYNTYIYADPLNADTVYVGTRDVFKSTNGAVTWTNITKNYTNGNYNPGVSKAHPDQHTLTFSPSNSNTIYIGNDGGLYKSTDAGLTFQSLNSGLSIIQFVGYAMHPTDPSISYGGTQDNGSQRRADAVTGGWNEFFSGDGGNVVINPLDSNSIFTTYIYGDIRRWTNSGAIMSYNGQVGSNSTFGESSTNQRIAFYPPFVSNGVDATLYFGTWRLFTSINLGATWNAPGGTTDLTRGGSDVLSAIAVSRTNTNVIYTGSEQGRVMVSTDGGASWSQINGGLPNRFISSIKVDANDPSIAYLTVSGYGSGHIFKTINGTTPAATIWADISGNLPNIPTSTSLVDPMTPTILYVGTDIGVFRSLTGGFTWESFNSGLPPVVVTGMVSNSAGSIQISTYGRGAYELTSSPAGSSMVQFSAPNYTFSEGAGDATLTVTRTGDTTSAATVDVKTVDNTAAVRCDDTTTSPGIAFARCDYVTTVDTLSFAAGETSKNLLIPLIDDAYVEPAESVQVVITNPSGGATLGTPSTATLTILDNDVAGEANPIDASTFFVRQQYLDFLSREPDTAGYNSWLNVLNNCTDVNNSINCDRRTVSSSFFRSPEFQLKGFFVYRFYRLAFNRLPTYGEIVVDMRSVTGATPSEVYAKKGQFAGNFTARADFKNAYDTIPDATFVNTLMDRYALPQITTLDPAAPDGTAKVTLSRSDLISKLSSNILTRAQVLRAIADSDEVSGSEFNRAFVAMQYFGYLRRDPDANGYNGWLNYLNANPTDYRTMVNGFMNSVEYRLRFGTP